MYNLKADPFEQKDLATSKPAELKKTMQGLIDSLVANNALYPTGKNSKAPVKPELPK